MITVALIGNRPVTLKDGQSTKVEDRNGKNLLVVLDRNGKPVAGGEFEQDLVQAVQKHDQPLSHLPAPAPVAPSK